MNRPTYTPLKVNNEIELCEIADLYCKLLIEQALLKERISFYIRWPKSSFFNRRKNTCVFCVNENVLDEAEDIVRSICDEGGYPVRFLFRKSHNQYL